MPGCCGSQQQNRQNMRVVDVALHMALWRNERKKKRGLSRRILATDLQNGR
jgi:hypothetical protein